MHAAALARKVHWSRRSVVFASSIVAGRNHAPVDRVFATQRHERRVHVRRGHVERIFAPAGDHRRVPGDAESPTSAHWADDDASACKRWLAIPAFLLLASCHCERTGVAHIVPGCPDPAVGALDLRDAELVDMAVEGIGDAAHVLADAEDS